MVASVAEAAATVAVAAMAVTVVAVAAMVAIAAEAAATAEIVAEAAAIAAATKGRRRLVIRAHSILQANHPFSTGKPGGFVLCTIASHLPPFDRHSSRSAREPSCSDAKPTVRPRAFPPPVDAPGFSAFHGLRISA